jgi:hypothetical protein
MSGENSQPYLFFVESNKARDVFTSAEGNALKKLGHVSLVLIVVL